MKKSKYRRLKAYVCIMDSQDMTRQYQFYHNILAGEFAELPGQNNMSSGAVIGTEPFCPSCLATIKQKANDYITGIWEINGSTAQNTTGS